MCLLRLAQLFSTCVAFSLVASVKAWSGFTGSWCMFAWCFCFTTTLFIILVEFGGFQARFPLSWRNFPITLACYASLFCLSASIIYPTIYFKFMFQSRSSDHAVGATVFSCTAGVAYATEVAWSRPRPGQVTVYMATLPGLLKVVETFVACVIFAFISDPYLNKGRPALVWCVLVYVICFLLASVAVVLNLINRTNILPIPFPRFLWGLNLLSILCYASAMILWPLYQFDERYGGYAERWKDPYCRLGLSRYICPWDSSLAVAILTGINLLTYVADWVYSSRLVFLRSS
ncbi:PREDICTED: myeloid-associated differentiation marker-like [Miniopterus natalensis]|uniref:myeloid-associated differentiation marker-like n=1 Tax=Miniopterus natalensis TaxID=291302 RepID=UPI0007A6D7A7|nr:PREDICTED: myeloid-associated differentiation marker-like [Miniopterus natalensis]